MATVKEIEEYLETLAPKEWAEDFDNVGLLVGNRAETVTKILVTLDVDMAVAKEAAEKGAELIISHHPIIFHPMKCVSSDSTKGDLIWFLASHHISVYSMHTNLDAAPDGLNDFLLSKLGFSSTEILESGKETVGVGRIVTFSEGITIGTLAEKVKEVFGLPFVKYTEKEDKTIHRLAVCSGSGNGMIEDAKNQNCDAFLTGDVNYTNARIMMEEGMSLIDLGHYESEFIVTEWFSEHLKKAFPEISVSVSEENKNVFSYL